MLTYLKARYVFLLTLVLLFRLMNDAVSC